MGGSNSKPKGKQSGGVSIFSMGSIRKKRRPTAARQGNRRDLPQQFSPRQHLQTVIVKHEVPTSSHLEEKEMKRIAPPRPKSDILQGPTVDPQQLLPSVPPARSQKPIKNVQKKLSVTPTELSPKDLQRCECILAEAVKEAAKHHDNRMTSLLQLKKGAYREADIERYHRETSKVVINALRRSLKGLTALKSPQLDEAIEKEVTQLQDQMDSQLVVYKRRHEILLEKIAKDIKMSSIEVENTYYQHMDNNEKKSKEHIQRIHQECLEKALEELKGRLDSKGYYSEGNMAELKERLNDNLINLLEEWEEQH